MIYILIERNGRTKKAYSGTKGKKTRTAIKARGSGVQKSFTLLEIKTPPTRRKTKAVFRDS